MFNFNINWRLWVARNTDTERRQSKRLAWLYALIVQLQNYYNLFLSKLEQSRSRIKYNCQVIYLERALNERFNSSLPAYTNYDPEGVSDPVGIYIAQGDSAIGRLYIYNKAELRPKTFIYNKSEGAAPAYMYNRTEVYSQPDFVVFVPFSVGNVTTDIALQKAIRAFVNLYRYAGKRFSIVNYTP